MEKASFYKLDNGNAELFMNVMFNPASYTIDSRASYTAAGGLEIRKDILQFSKVGVRELNMELYFDTINTNQNGASGAVTNMLMTTQLAGLFSASADDVSAQVDKLRQLIELTDEKGTPPIIEFHWGSFIFRGVMVSMHENYTMFLPDGRPVKATVSVTIDEYPLSKMTSLPFLGGAESKLTENVSSSQKDDLKTKAEAVIASVIV